MSNQTRKAKVGDPFRINLAPKKEASPLQYYQALAQSAMTVADEAGPNIHTELLQLNPETIEEEINSNLQKIIDEAHVAGEIDESYESDEEDAGLGSLIAGDTFKNSKEHGEPYQITCNYIFQDSLNAFTSDPETTSKTICCEGLTNCDHKQIILKSKITIAQNSTPFGVDFKLNNAPMSNLHLDTNPNAYKNVTFKIPPNLRAPMKVGAVIYEKVAPGSSPVDTTGSPILNVQLPQWQYSNVTAQEIENSIQFPPNLTVTATMDPATAASIEDLRKKIDSSGFCFVKKDSPLGTFITSEIQNNHGNVASHMMNNDAAHPDHAYLQKTCARAHMENLARSVASSPFGNIHGMEGKITRDDGKAWNYMPQGIPEEEANDLLNNRQTVHVTVCHTVQAFQW